MLEIEKHGMELSGLQAEEFLQKGAGMELQTKSKAISVPADIRLRVLKERDALNDRELAFFQDKR